MTRRTPGARPRDDGFTLVEVMVALVVATLGLSAVITIAANAIDNARVFRDRAMALYIGMNVITEMRLDAEFPEVRETDDELEFAAQEWLWTARVTETEVETLRRIEVDVAFAQAADDVVRTVTGFVGEPVQGGAGNSVNSVWQNFGGEAREAPDSEGETR